MGLQEVVVVVCNLLPVEEKYADWVIFSPTDSPKWREALRMFALQRNWQLLDMAKGLSKKEYEATTPELEEIFKQYWAEDLERFLKDQREASKLAIANMRTSDPQGLLETISALKPEERIAGLKPEELVESLTPEQLEQLLKLVSEKKPGNDKN